MIGGRHASPGRPVRCLGQGQGTDQGDEEGVQRVDFDQDGLRPEGVLKGEGQAGQHRGRALAGLVWPQGLHQPGDDGNRGGGAESREQGHALRQFCEGEMGKEPGE